MRTYGGTISTDGGNSMQQRVSLVGHFKSRGTMEKDILFQDKAARGLNSDC